MRLKLKPSVHQSALMFSSSKFVIDALDVIKALKLVFFSSACMVLLPKIPVETVYFFPQSIRLGI